MAAESYIQRVLISTQLCTPHGKLHTVYKLTRVMLRTSDYALPGFNS